MEKYRLWTISQVGTAASQLPFCTTEDWLGSLVEKGIPELSGFVIEIWMSVARSLFLERHSFESFVQPQRRKRCCAKSYCEEISASARGFHMSHYTSPIKEFPISGAETAANPET